MIPWPAILPAAGRLLTGWQGYAAAAAVAAAVAGGAAWTVQGWRLSAQVERLKADHAEAMLDAEQSARERERVMIDKVEVIVRDAQALTQDLARDAARAAAAGDSVRDAARRAAAVCAGADATAVGASAAARAAGDVLADVLGMVESAGRAMAAEADRRRIAGITCERQYDEVRGAAR